MPKTLQDLKNLISQTVKASDSSGRFGYNLTPTHEHTGLDSPQVSYLDLTHRQFTVTSVVAGNLAAVGGTVTFTGTLSSGATSGTLTAAWSNPTGLYLVKFSNGDIRYVSFTIGSASVSWSPGLSSGATASAHADGYYGPFWIAPFPCSIQEIQQAHTADGSAGTLFLEILESGQISGGGTAVVFFDMTTGANGVATSTLRRSGTAKILNTGDRLSLFMSGTPAGLAQVVVTVLLQAV